MERVRVQAGGGSGVKEEEECEGKVHQAERRTQKEGSETAKEMRHFPHPRERRERHTHTQNFLKPPRWTNESD